MKAHRFCYLQIDIGSNWGDQRTLARTSEPCFIWHFVRPRTFFFCMNSDKTVRNEFFVANVLKSSKTRRNKISVENLKNNFFWVWILPLSSNQNRCKSPNNFVLIDKIPTGGSVCALQIAMVNRKLHIFTCSSRLQWWWQYIDWQFQFER